MNPVIIYAIIGTLILFVTILVLMNEKKKSKKFIKNARTVVPGMMKEKLIYLLGDNYTHSCLKNDIEELEWFCGYIGYLGKIFKSIYMHINPLARRISVKIKDGCVIEVCSMDIVGFEID